MQEFGRFYFLNEYGQELVKVVEANLPRNSRLNNHTPSRRERRETLSTRITLLEKPVGQLCNTFQKTSATSPPSQAPAKPPNNRPTFWSHWQSHLQQRAQSLVQCLTGSGGQGGKGAEQKPLKKKTKQQTHAHKNREGLVHKKGATT